MIVIPNIDKMMVSVETLVPLMIKEYLDTGSLTVHLNDEGPDAYELGLYNLLDSICKTFNFDPLNITIVTNNVLEKHARYKIRRQTPLYVRDIQGFIKLNPLKEKSIEYAFGLFVGRSNHWRLILSSYLYSKYRQSTLQTFLFDPKSDYHLANIGIEETIKLIGTEYDFHAIIELLRDAPLELEDVNEFPILVPENFNIGKLYYKIFVDIVCETYTYGTTFYPTEKTWRPIACMTPFMVQGPVGHLKNLKLLGFKTFDKWWDESYDEDGEVVALKTLQRNADMLSTKSKEELNKMYIEMMPTLEHNRKVLMSLTNSSWKIFDGYK